MSKEPSRSGLSLWLVPPEHSDLYKAIDSLILTTIPSLFSSRSGLVQFTPHITLTADTVPQHVALADPQRWLDGLPLSDALCEGEVLINDLRVGDIFFQKLVMDCDKTPALRGMAAASRAAARGSQPGVTMDMDIINEAAAWFDRDYVPHCSLLYADLSVNEVQSKLDEVKAKIHEIKVANIRTVMARGGSIWLIPTYKDVKDWKPIASKEVKGIKWKWST